MYLGNKVIEKRSITNLENYCGSEYSEYLRNQYKPQDITTKVKLLVDCQTNLMQIQIPQLLYFIEPQKMRASFYKVAKRFLSYAEENLQPCYAPFFKSAEIDKRKHGDKLNVWLFLKKYDYLGKCRVLRNKE